MMMENLGRNGPRSHHLPDQIGTAWEEASFERTQKKPTSSECRVVRNEALAKHYCTPRESEEGEPVGGANFAKDDVGWQLEQHVGWEKDHQANGVTVAYVELQILLHARDTGGRDL